MHIITIQQTHCGSFNVLLNGHSYRIHRNLSKRRAEEIAAEAQSQFRAMRQRSRIECGDAHL